MSPKRKSSIPPTGVKPDKKGNKITKENVPALEDDDDQKKVNLGKDASEKKYNAIGFYGFKKEDSLLVLFDKNNNIQEVEYPNLALNQLLKQKSKISLQGSLRWKTFLFPLTDELVMHENHTYTFLGPDLVDEDKERTHWTHKPSVWENLFEGIIEMAKTGKAPSIHPMFNGILSCPVCAVPKGLDEIKTFKSANNQNTQHWIMLIKKPYSTHMDFNEYIDWFLTWF